MPESASHVALVAVLRGWALSHFGTRDGVTILSDGAGVARDRLPPRIGGFVPDLYASNTPRTRVAIGEAKTSLDLETEHTIAQLMAFFSFLVNEPGPCIAVAVPWQSVNTAKALLKRVRAASGALQIPCVIVDGLGMHQLGPEAQC